MASAAKQTNSIRVPRTPRAAAALPANAVPFIERQVNYIAMSRVGGGHEDITAIGGSLHGKMWTVSIEEAIADIRSGRCFYYTVGFYSGEKRYLAVVAAKRPYLRAHSQGKWNDNLLAHPCIEA